MVARSVNEGEGDLLVAGEVILAGTGFRTDPRAHAEAARVFGREVVTLELVDPRFYHLDTALAVLDDDHDRLTARGVHTERARCWPSRYPGRGRSPRAEDAAVLGLNAVTDGHHVVLPAEATGLAARARRARLHPVPVDLSELLKGGGGPKCCTLELRA